VSDYFCCSYRNVSFAPKKLVNINFKKSSERMKNVSRDEASSEDTTMIQLTTNFKLKITTLLLTVRYKVIAHSVFNFELNKTTAT
jgi:archaellum component FlaF (FlaF/FlaG flagellin family)